MWSLEEEISAMKSELEKYGIQMPSFGKIGGILANEVGHVTITWFHVIVLFSQMSVDEAAG